MSERNDGGPAFPQVETDLEYPASTCAPWGHTYSYGGMSLRDYFAAKAMQAEIITSCSDATPESAESLARACAEHNQTPQERIAMHAYDWADAMLKTREAK